MILIEQLEETLKKYRGWVERFGESFGDPAQLNGGDVLGNGTQAG